MGCHCLLRYIWLGYVKKDVLMASLAHPVLSSMHDSAGEGSCAVCVSKKASLCLVGTRNWPSCRMLTIAASVTDVLLFRDSFCGI